MTYPNCDVRKIAEMSEVLRQVRSNSSRENLLALWHKLPYMPKPSVSEHHSPVFDFGGMCRMTKDYLDFPVYEIAILMDWKRVTEAEFIKFMKIHWSL